MKTQFKGSDVQVLRDAKPGDPGYDADNGEQALIKLADGSQKSVIKSELKTIHE